MVTTGGELPCQYVINVVGPRCEKKQEDISLECKQLKSVVKNILKATVDYDLRSVCILAVSTGLFHFPLKEWIKIFAKTIKKFIDRNTEAMEGRELILCNFDEKTTKAMRKVIELIKAGDEDHNIEEENEELSKQDDLEKEQKEPGTKSYSRCGKCNKKIKDTQHQANGKNLDQCYNCYLEEHDKKKEKKRTMLGEDVKENKKQSTNSNLEEEKRNIKDRKTPKETPKPRVSTVNKKSGHSSVDSEKADRTQSDQIGSVKSPGTDKSKRR